MNAEATSADILRAPSRATSSLIAEAFVAAGLPDADAARCAELMTEADLTGADGHGIFRLPQYVRRLKAGGFNKRPNITISRTAPATALVDGDNGMGHLVMSRATDEAIAMARDTGVAWVGVRRPNHAGPAGLYAEMPAAHGMVGLYAAVANANHMATWGGADLLLGTNPLAIGVPTGDRPLVFDRDVVDFNAADESATNTGHCVAAIDIARFLPLQAFTAEVDRHMHDLRASRRLPGVNVIRLPGDRRAACRDERLRDGVPIPAALCAQLDNLAAELQIKPLRER